MSDESELNRLRADLEAMERYEGRMYTLAAAKAEIRNKIAKLEAAADPWREAREAIPLHIESGGHKVKEVARYARHLEDEGVWQQMKIAGLQDENARLTERVAELEDVKPIADMQPPFEGPIVGIDPVLEPARVLATAVNVLGSLYKKKQSHEVWTILQNLDQDAKPYPLKKGGSDAR